MVQLVNLVAKIAEKNKIKHDENFHVNISCLMLCLHEQVTICLWKAVKLIYYLMIHVTSY